VPPSLAGTQNAILAMQSLDGGLGMRLVSQAFMQMIHFSFSGGDLWMPGAWRVRLGFTSHRPPDRSW
jgi:hypothetical protein